MITLDPDTGLVTDTDGDQAEPMSPLPSLSEVRTYVGTPEQLLSDTDLSRMYLTAINDQDLRCRFPAGTVEVIDEETGEITAVPTRPTTLVQGLLRRVQRSIATKGLPLGMLGSDSTEYGPTSVPRFDVMIESDEGSYRRVVAG